MCEADHTTPALGIGTAMVVQCGSPLVQTCAQGGGCWVLFTLHVDRPSETECANPCWPIYAAFSHASWRYQWMTSWQGHLATCAVLLKASADPQLVCSQGRTALHHACAGASRPRDLRAGWSAGFLRCHLKLFKVRKWDVRGLIGMFTPSSYCRQHLGALSLAPWHQWDHGSSESAMFTSRSSAGHIPSIL